MKTILTLLRSKLSRDLSWSFIGGIVAFTILFFAQIIAARWLGPEEYGRYSVIFAIAQILSMFLVLDSDIAITHFLAKKSKKERSAIASSAIVLFITTLIVIGVLTVGILGYLNIAYTFSLSIAAVIALKRFSEGFLRGLSYFKSQALFKVFEGALVILAATFAAIFLEPEYSIFVWIIIVAGLAYFFLGILRVRSVFSSWEFSPQTLREIFHYSKFGALNSVAESIVKNIDKILIATFLGVGYAGVYAAYYTVAVLASAKVVQLIGNVAFPTLSKQSNISGFFKKTKRIFFIWSVPLFLAAFVGISVLMTLYGSQYPYHIEWVFLLSLYIVVHFFASLLGWMLASRSKDGYKKQNYAHVVGLMIYGVMLGISIFVFDYFSITLIICALLAYRLYAILAYMRALKRTV